MTKARLFTLTALLQIFIFTSSAQKEYYASIDDIKGGATLKTALYNLIKEHTVISYGKGETKTWGAFYTTDAVVEDGQRRVLDMYSDEKRYFGSKGEAVSGMNIEHSVAKSWWGGTENNAYCDLHHLNPSDQSANSSKSNYPLGELTSVSWDNGVTFVGKANVDGSSQNAFEPCDEYKGDFARTYMYMFTCYQNLTWKYTWMNYENSAYPTLKPWAVQLLLKWHKQDPVSEKEVNRNNAVHAVQGNRNPFIDYPQLADYVWGDSVNYIFHLNGDVENGSGNTGSSDTGNEMPEWKEYINENFDGTTMVFYTQESTGNFPWELSSKYKMAVVTSYISSSSTSNDAESWLISPSLNFSKDSVAKISFDYVIRYCESGKDGEYHQLLISNDYVDDVESATWESIDFEATANESSWDVTSVSDITLPEKYMGDSNVTIAFYYKGTATKAGTFEIDNVLLQAIEGKNNGNGTTAGGDNSGTDGNNGNFTGEAFTLVTDASKLSAGDTIIIVYENYAMGQQNGNYRQKTDVLINSNKVTYLADDAQKIVLEEGTVDGSYAFNVGDGYLAAASSSNNHLITETELTGNSSWLITINSDTYATIQAQGDKTRNILQYNTSSPRFSCYKGTQKSVCIYAKSPATTGISGSETQETVNVYSIDGTCLRKNAERENSVDGLGKGIYIIDGKKVLVK